MFFEMASALMPIIVERQTPDVDTVTGATYSSTGIINAVKQALERAANPTPKPIRNRRRLGSRAAAARNRIPS